MWWNFCSLGLVLLSPSMTLGFDLGPWQTPVAFTAGDPTAGRPVAVTADRSRRARKESPCHGAAASNEKGPEGAPPRNPFCLIFLCNIHTVYIFIYIYLYLCFFFWSWSPGL